MPTKISRREMIAWLAAGTGAAAAGTTIFAGSGSTSTNRSLSGAADSMGRIANAGTTAPASGAGPILRPGLAPSSERLLVVVEMMGGNDGLSMAVPYGDGAYYDLRDQTAIADSEVLDIDGQIGLHPELTQLYERGVGIVEGIGSFEPDGSHFEMQRRWWAGDSVEAASPTGWIGRLADTLQADSQQATPATAMTITSGSHPALRSATGSTVSMPGVDSLWAVAGAREDEDHMRWVYQRALRSLGESDSIVSPYMQDGFEFAERMLELGLDDESAEELGYDNWGFGASLQFAAAVFSGGIGVRVVHVQAEGDYDTHEGHAWRHPELMRELDANLGAFHRDAERRGLADKVLVMTTSEFGRTVAENRSGGLDHGTASTMLLSGAGVTGRFGEAPSLTARDDNDDLVATAPFEAYLGGVVEHWLDVPATEIFETEALPLDLT